MPKYIGQKPPVAGVIDQDVDTAKITFSFDHETLAKFLDAKIAGNCDSSSALAADEVDYLCGIRFFLWQVVDCNIGAFASIGDCGCTSDPDDNYAAGGALKQPVEPEIPDAFFRMVELLDTPERIPVLAPLIVKEIHYHLLIGPNGGCLRSFYALGSQNNQITRAISWLKQNLTASILVAGSFFSEAAETGYTEHGKANPVTGINKYKEHKRREFMTPEMLSLIGESVFNNIL
jgi:hypothetical protein